MIHLKKVFKHFLKLNRRLSKMFICLLKHFLKLNRPSKMFICLLKHFPVASKIHYNDNIVFQKTIAITNKSQITKGIFGNFRQIKAEMFKHKHATLTNYASSQPGYQSPHAT